MRSLFLFILCVAMLPFTLAAKDLGPSQTIPAGGTLRGRFTLEHYFKNSDTPLHSEGSFVVAPAYGLIWAVEKPLPLNVTVTPVGLTQGIGTFPPMQVSAQRYPFLRDVGAMIGNAIAGNWRELEEDFTITQQADGPVGGGAWQAKLVPKKKSIPFATLVIYGDQIIRRAVLTRRDTGRDVVIFHDHAASAKPPEAAEIAAFAKIGP